MAFVGCTVGCTSLQFFFAFAGQMPIGILADKFKRNALVASVGCVLVLAGVAVGGAGIDAAFAAAMVAGLGNAMFHMGGGIDVLNGSGQKSGLLGIYVSPGALGLFIGVAYGKPDAHVMEMSILLMALCAVGIYIFQKCTSHSMKSCNVSLSFRVSSVVGKKMTACAIAALFVVVTLRAYVGLTLSFDWKSEGYWAVALAIALVDGKAFGGILSDKFGMQKMAGVTLGLASVLFLFPSNPVCGVLSVLLFNMTMPMTLWALSRLFNQARGFAFGTLSCALFIGFVITIVHPDPILPMGWGFTLATILSIFLLFVGLHAVLHAT